LSFSILGNLTGSTELQFIFNGILLVHHPFLINPSLFRNLLRCLHSCPHFYLISYIIPYASSIFSPWTLWTIIDLAFHSSIDRTSIWTSTWYCLLSYQTFLPLSSHIHVWSYHINTPSLHYLWTIHHPNIHLYSLYLLPSNPTVSIDDH